MAPSIEVHRCPVCGSTHVTEGGVVVHMENTRDADHAHIDSRREAWRMVIEGETSPEAVVG